MKPIIEVENLSKQYTIGEMAPYRSLREEIMRTITAPFRRRIPSGNNSIWALKDVSFAVREGEVVGIIGRNGAGKSTLLKILSRITEPTEGRVVLKGRVASLLEVGTGFHPELTGRENILLNGALLGMKHKEIRDKFDEIVAFAEIEKFLDTPVKRYSSGMYVRLAFSVAAHLDPEILLVDEVLAVGDSGFQKKCLGKMEDVAKGGRTVLFVSHNMGAVATLTRNCVELSEGVVTKIGPTEDVIRHYLMESIWDLGSQGCFDLKEASRPLHKVNPNTAKAFFVGAYCRDSTGKSRSTFYEREPIKIEAHFELRKPIDSLEVHSVVTSMMEVRVFAVLSEVMDISLKPGLYQIGFAVDPNYLRHGTYYGTLGLYTPFLQDAIRHAFQFRIEPTPEAEENVNWSADVNSPSSYLGVVRLPYKWAMPESIGSD